jgi:hypothetical protein
MRETDGVPIGQCRHIVCVQALPAKQGDGWPRLVVSD